MNREILRLAWPNILSNISVPLLSTVDTALMGHLSALHLGAIGIGSMIFNFLYWNFGFLRMGTTGLTAQAYGAGERHEQVLTLARALLLATGLALLLLLFQKPLAEIGMELMNSPETHRPLIMRYFLIRIWAAPASLGLYVLAGWFFGMQNAKYPLYITLFVNFVNIVLSWVLVKNFGMEVEGVAWGTVVAQYAGLLLAISIWNVRYLPLFSMHSGFRQMLSRPCHKLRLLLANHRPFLHFLRINRDIFLRTLMLTSAFALFYSRSALLGATVLALNTVLLQFLNWMSYGVDGFAFAAESVVGKYKGKKDAEKLQRAVKLSLRWGMALATLFAALYYFAGEVLTALFTSDQQIQQAVQSYLIWMTLLPFFGAPSYIWDGIFVGLTAARAMRNSMAIAFATYLAMLYLGPHIAPDPNHALWAAMLVFLGMRGLIQHLLYNTLPSP